MPKSNKAGDSFIRTSQRALALIELHTRLVQAGVDQRIHSSDLVRSAVVLSVAAMDAYFTRRFEDIVIPYVKKHGPSPGIIELLQKAGLDTEQALTMATMDRPFRRVRTLVHSYLETYTTQRFDVIDQLFLSFGLKDLCANAQGMTGRKTLLRSVEILVDRRHKIVHEGDLDGHGKLRRIEPLPTLHRIRDMTLLVRKADELIDKAIQEATAVVYGLG